MLNFSQLFLVLFLLVLLYFNSNTPAIPVTENNTGDQGSHGNSSNAESSAINANSVDVGAKYNPKSCKYHSLPKTLDTHGYLNYDGEVYIADVFGIPQVSKEEVIRFTIGKNVNYKAFIAVSAELHRDSASEFVYMDLYKASHREPFAVQYTHSQETIDNKVNEMRGRAIRWGDRVYGAGGEKSKAFFNYEISSDGEELYEIVFSIKEMVNLSQDGAGIESMWKKSSCLPIRLDLAIVPVHKMTNHIPKHCPKFSYLPTVHPHIVLNESGIGEMNEVSKPYVYVFDGNRIWKPFEKAVWTITVDVPLRMHRFVRFHARVSFRFISGPFQILIELYGKDETPNDLDEKPECHMGCMGGTPTFNGQLLDHAMPTDMAISRGTRLSR